MAKKLTNPDEIKDQLARISLSWRARYIAPDALEPIPMALATAKEEGLILAADELQKFLEEHL